MESDRVVLDSNIFIAFYCESDSGHEKAVKVFNDIRYKTLVVHPYVVEETATVLTYKVGHRAAAIFLSDIVQSHNVFIPTIDVHEESECFRTIGKKISFTDAALINLANRLNAPIVTFDRQIIALLKK